MGYRLKKKCEKCGAYLLVMVGDDYVPGNKAREEVNCPRCGTEVYSTMTSGFLDVVEISEDEFNDEMFS